MGRFRRTLVGALTLGCVLIGTQMGPAEAVTATATTPPQVKVKDVGDPGLYGEALVSVAVRCFDRADLKQLAVEMTQGDVIGNRVVDSGVVCDGVRRTIPVWVSTDGPDFNPGPAVVKARLTVLDPKTGSPLPPVSSTAPVFLRPQVVVRVATGPVRLNANGNAVVRASIMCRTPWISTSFGVTLTQNGGRIVGRSSYIEEPPCDNAFHEYRFTVVPTKPFVRGGIRVSTSMFVLDPGSYDPAFAAAVDTNRQALPWGQ